MSTSPDIIVYFSNSNDMLLNIVLNNDISIPASWHKWKFLVEETQKNPIHWFTLKKEFENCEELVRIDDSVDELEKIAYKLKEELSIKEKHFEQNHTTTASSVIEEDIADNINEPDDRHKELVVEKEVIVGKESVVEKEAIVGKEAILENVAIDNKTVEFFIPLHKSTRAYYDKTLKSLEKILQEPRINYLHQRRADDFLSMLRESCNGYINHAKDNKREFSKLSFLKNFLKQNQSFANKKIVIFTRWDPVSSQISEALREMDISCIRYYRKLNLKRRELVFSKLRDSDDNLILVTTDTEWPITSIEADCIIHFDLPWDSSVISWRRSKVSNFNNCYEAILISSNTIESQLWNEYNSSISNFNGKVEEEDIGTPFVHLFSKDQENYILLKKIIGIDTTTQIKEDITVTQSSESIVETEHLEDKLDDKSDTIYIDTVNEVDVIITAEDITTESDSVTNITGSNFVDENKDTVTSYSDNDNEIAPIEKCCVEEKTSDQKQEITAEERTHKKIDNISDSESNSNSSSTKETPITDIIANCVEYPLKMVNKKISHIPIIGRPLSELNRFLWHITIKNYSK